MKKFLLAGASALAVLGFAGSAQAQLVEIDIGGLLEGVQGDVDGFGGVYINSAVQNALIDGSVEITPAGLVPGLNASAINVTTETSAATAAAVTGGSLNPLTGDVVLPNAATSGASAIQNELSVVGTTVSSIGTLSTSAIGAINTGTIALSALSTSDTAATNVGSTVGADLTFDSAASDSASNTSNTAARAAAAASRLVVDGGLSAIDQTFDQTLATGPAAILASNLAVQNGIIDGSLSIAGAAATALNNVETQAIGAVNTGTITNGLPGTITITVD